MGSKLAVLAAVIAFAAARGASADGNADLKQGIDFYKAGKYAEAAVALKKSYDVDPKPETLFALAQAERLNGDCADAATHYHKVIEQVSDFNVAKLVQQNLALCERQVPAIEPKHEIAATPETKTVVREVAHTDKLAASLFALGALGLGAAGGLYVAASSNRDAADRARTLDDHDTLSDRASGEQKAMFVAGGVGVALIGVAVFRWVRGGDRAPTEVAVIPTSTGGVLAFSSRW